MSLGARIAARTGQDPRVDGERDVDEPPFALLLLSMLPLLLLRYPPREVRSEGGAAAFKRRLEGAQESLVRGASLAEAAGTAGGWVERVTTLLDPYRHARTTQVVRTWRPPGEAPGSKEERVRLILWRAMLRDLRLPALQLPVEVLAFLTAAPVDAVLPPERPDPVWRLRAGRQYVRELLPVILGMAGR